MAGSRKTSPRRRIAWRPATQGRMDQIAARSRPHDRRSQRARSNDQEDYLRNHVDVTELVPGDVVLLRTGDLVPADLRLLDARELECDEAVLTGEAMPKTKRSEPEQEPDLIELGLRSIAYMGTTVRGGSGSGIVLQTGSRTAFGKIAVRLGERQPETVFQRGLRSFSILLVRVTALLAGGIFVANSLLGRPILESALFSLAIAVGLTPPSCCRRSSLSAWPRARAGWPASGSWSSGWSASRTSATSRSSSPTRRAPHRGPDQLQEAIDPAGRRAANVLRPWASLLFRRQLGPSRLGQRPGRSAAHRRRLPPRLPTPRPTALRSRTAADVDAG